MNWKEFKGWFKYAYAGDEEDFKSKLREAMESVVPKKEKTCDCENSELGYHSKECDFEPYGVNRTVDKIKNNIVKFFKED